MPDLRLQPGATDESKQASRSNRKEEVSVDGPVALAADCAVSISAFRPKEAARPASQQFERLNGTGLRIAYRYKLPPPQPRLNSTGPLRSVGLSANRAGIERRNEFSTDQSPLSRRPIEPRRPSLSLTTLVRRAGKPASRPVGPSTACFAELPFGWTAAAFRPAAFCFLSFPLLLIDGAPPSCPVAAGTPAGVSVCRVPTCRLRTWPKFRMCCL